MVARASSPLSTARIVSGVTCLGKTSLSTAQERLSPASQPAPTIDAAPIELARQLLRKPRRVVRPADGRSLSNRESIMAETPLPCHHPWDEHRTAPAAPRGLESPGTSPSPAVSPAARR